MSDEPQTPLEQQMSDFLKDMHEKDHPSILLYFPVQDGRYVGQSRMSTISEPQQTELLFRVAANLSPVFRPHLDEAIRQLRGLPPGNSQHSS